MDQPPAEPADDPPDPEKPRFLLPDGCKDLIDALHLRDAPHLPPSSPIVIPDPVTILELASLLRVKPFELLSSLMELNIFASIHGSIPFETAASVSAHYGLVAQRID
jgi:hypothetical protein